MAIDAITERSFYHNMTLRVIEQLENQGDIMDIQMKHKRPCDINNVISWEKEHSCVLPIDLKNFYLSIDGFELTYCLVNGGESYRVGSMKINKLHDFKRIHTLTSDSEDYGLVEEVLQVLEKQNNPSCNQKPAFSDQNCKIFLLEEAENVGAICAVINGQIAESPIWLLDFSYDWHLLAPNFTKYFRMMIYYQGLPEWQLLLTPLGLSPWAEQLMNSIAPELCSPPPAPKILEPKAIELDQNILKATESKEDLSEQELD